MGKTLIITLPLLLVLSLVGLVYTGSSLVEAREENFKHNHVVMQCDGAYFTFQGNQDRAIQWAQKHCPLDYEYVPNQDYDSTL